MVFKDKSGYNLHCLAEPIHKPVVAGTVPREISVKAEEAAISLALGPLCCPTCVAGAMSDHTYTLDQDSSRSHRSLWHFVLHSLLPPPCLSLHSPQGWEQAANICSSFYVLDISSCLRYCSSNDRPPTPILQAVSSL